MGRSQTINCIGEGPETDNHDGTYSRRVYYAMSRVEIAQEVRKAEKRGETIEKWYAQTKTGNKSLGADYDGELVLTNVIPLPKLITCPICNGEGSRRLNSEPDFPFVKNCPVCNSSGITKNGSWDRWQDWQLESMKADFS